MDATHEVPDLDPRRDAMACAVVRLAMVMSAACAALIVNLEVSVRSFKPHPEMPARCVVARGVSIF